MWQTFGTRALGRGTERPFECGCSHLPSSYANASYGVLLSGLQRHRLIMSTTNRYLARSLPGHPQDMYLEPPSLRQFVSRCLIFMFVPSS